MTKIRTTFAVYALGAMMTIGMECASGQQIKLVTEQLAPEFSRYRTSVYVGRIADPRIAPDSARFRSKIAAAAGRLPNFAGRYHIVTWGCGAGCRMGAVIDVQSGRVTMLPFAVSGTLEHKADSRLLVVEGIRDESEEDDDADRHFYAMSASSLTYIATLRTVNSE